MEKRYEFITATEVENLIRLEENEEQKEVLMRFFKTGPGQYGEGDRFLGLKVPKTRSIVRGVKGKIPLNEIEKLLDSNWHEIRLAGFLLLVEEMKSQLPKKKYKGNYQRRKEIAELYLKNAYKANNWDLVDLSAEYILGPFIRFDSPDDWSVLSRLAESDNLWEQRISIVTTLDFIRKGWFEPTLNIADKLLHRPHDLIHKAIGWMLREIGKRDYDTLIAYLHKRYDQLPRTSLRYAIERMPENERKYWLNNRGYKAKFDKLSE